MKTVEKLHSWYSELMAGDVEHDVAQDPGDKHNVEARPASVAPPRVEEHGEDAGVNGEAALGFSGLHESGECSHDVRLPMHGASRAL